MTDRTKADAYERGMQEGLDLRDQLREQLANRDQDLKILGKERDRLRAENERLREALTSTTVHTCREWLDEKANYCHAPAEFLIWGKLTPPNGLGPRCYDHAAEHVGYRALGDPSWAIVDLRPAREALAFDEEQA